MEEQPTEDQLMPEERYRRDPVFFALVNTLRSQLQQYQFTPTELREAVMLAATMHEMERVRPIYIQRQPNE
ncbi:MAG: hypothetical protein ACE5M4_09095 [Anaerolineales bacterium]